MTIVEMLQQSTILTVLGMTIVFLFLWVMIVCVNLVGRLVHSMGWDKDVEPQKPAPPTGAGATPPEITTAITAAVVEYRKTEGK